MTLGDSYISSWFAIEFQGQITGAFRECTGLGSENAVIEDKSSGPKGLPIVKKIPGNLKWNDITLKQGITDDMDMWKWRELVENGDLKNARKNGAIVMFNHANKEVARWEFVNAWPSKISGPSINATSDDVAVEELTLVHEGYKRTK